MKKFETGKFKETEKFNLWFEHCLLKQIPYIFIYNRAKYYEVHWNYISFEKKYDKILIDDSHTLRSRLSDIFDKYANKKTKGMVSDIMFRAKEVLISTAPFLAEELFDVITEHIQKTTTANNF